MVEEKKSVLQWHPAFFAGLQIEFAEEAKYLEFESEHMLSSKPMQLDVLFRIQVIVQKQLSEKNNLWLRSLTNDLKEKAKVESLLWAYKEKQKDRLYRSVMQVIVNANKERFQVNDMCDALDEILEYHFGGKLEAGRQQGLAEGRAKGLAEGLAEGRAEGVIQGEQKALFTLVEKKIAKGKSLAQIADELEETEESILPLYKKAMGE